MLYTDTDNSINTMDELERRDLKGKFLSSKQKNTIAVLDHDHTYVNILSAMQREEKKSHKRLLKRFHIMELMRYIDQFFVIF